MEEKKTKIKIKKEDKKNFPKFLITIFISFLIGGMIGFGGIWTLENLSDKGISPLKFFMEIKPGVSAFFAYGLIVLSVCMFSLLMVNINKHIKQFKKWDGEDEEQYDQIDRKLSYDLLFINIYEIMEFLFYGLAICSFKYLVNNHFIVFIIMLAFYMISLFGCMILQKKIVNYYKLLNPEKSGSVYDTKFYKKWYDSCDEAEQALIGKAAKKAFEVVSFTCIALEILLILISMFFGVGIMAHIVVIFIWLIMTVTYFLEAMKK